MLASDEDGGSLAALRLSLGSDIVELVVLTGDNQFLQTLREAVGANRRLWHVPSADKVSDLLIAGQIGIVVIDVNALHEAASVFIGQIKRQFPDLVIVVAGHRDDEVSLATLISAGIVYRFIHKPMSPGRARLFAEAAIRKFDAQRRRAAESPQRRRSASSGRAWMIGGVVGLCVMGALIWIVQRGPPNASPSAGAQGPADARADVAEVHERLLARAENALLEERLDDAAAAIETARNAGVDSGRVAFLAAQLTKSREQLNMAQSQPQAPPQSRARGEGAPNAVSNGPASGAGARGTVSSSAVSAGTASPSTGSPGGLKAAADRDASRDPGNADAQEAQHELASRLIDDAHAAIDRRDFGRAAALIEGAKDIAGPASVDAARGHLASARHQADVDSWNELLKTANERLLQDRLVEPANDSAKYYLLALQQKDPHNPSLDSALKDLESRIIAKARQALQLTQYDTARNWLGEAGSLGFASDETVSLQKSLDDAARQNLAALVPASELVLVKSVQPVYPGKAQSTKTEGWVDVEFTVTEKGNVKDVIVRADSAPGVFDDAAVKAVSQWRYRPVLRDAKATPVRTQLRIRFNLT